LLVIFVPELHFGKDESMALDGTVQGAAPGLRGFDANTVITAAVAQQFFSQGYAFCVRYLSRGPQKSTDLSPEEATDILNSGLALFPVQHVSAAGWSPSGSLGQQYGAQAAVNAAGVGFPPGVNVWCDLEGVKTGTSAQDVIDYCRAWFDAVAAAGFVPGIYVGADAILSGQQLFDLPFQHYWKSLSNVPPIPNRGYQLVQHPSQMVNGIAIDVDTTQTDNEGGQVQWLVQMAQAQSAP
jgi:hypothetical protein